MNYIVLMLSKAEMILISKSLSRSSFLKDDLVFDKCRLFMDEIKRFYEILVAEICPIMIEACKNVLEFTNINHKIENEDCIKSLLLQLKRRADVSFSM